MSEREMKITLKAWRQAGPDAPGAPNELTAYTDWREGLARLARRDAAS